MGNIYGKFADQNDVVLTAQVQTSNNNQTALNATLAETDQVRGTAAIFQPTGLLATLTNDVPNVTIAAQGDIGAALGGVGQEGTPATQPGGGGNPPCFIATARIATPTGNMHIRSIEPGDIVFGFTAEGRVPQRVIGKHVKLTDEYLLVSFDKFKTGVTPNHRYWTRGDYAPIRDLDSVWMWDGEWCRIKIVSKTIVSGPVLVYNITVEGTHNYFADGVAVSNLCPPL